MAEEATVEERISQFLAIEDGDAPEEQPEPRAEQPERREEPEQPDQPEDPEQPEEQGEEETEERVISSLKELAEEIGMDVADLYKLEIPFPALAGEKEGKSMTLGEWKDSVTGQKFDEYAKTLETVKQREAELTESQERRQAEIQQFQQWAQQQAQQIQGLAQFAEQELIRDYQSINWQELRQYDPAEYAVKQEEFRQRQGAIQQAKQGSIQQMEQQRQELLKQSIPEQQQLLTKLIPEWKDESIANAEKPKVAEFLVKSGFKPEELQNLYDARLVALSHKAMKYDALKSSSPAKKKVLKIGTKPIKPGKSQSKSEQRASANLDQRSRLKKTGDLKDFAALLNTDEYLGDMR